jgi:hypothetical protein
MPGKLRWDNPRCGREGFDGRAGWPMTGVIGDQPDMSWRYYSKPPNKLIWENGQWFVTNFGLEISSYIRERYDAFRISAEELLTVQNSVYLWPSKAADTLWIDLSLFEEAFRRAIEEHHLTSDDDTLRRTFILAGMRHSFKLRRQIAKAKRQ